MPGFERMDVDDVVVRMLAGTVPMKLRVSKVTNQVITCGDWEFDRATGAEIDELLGWGPPPLTTGSYLDPSKTELSNPTANSREN
ncbi:hypothetical protein [Granulicella mallensis]|uniref:Uncharacterized protein n=1 Tax=Granulicella mallensis (strain ATCC BAA-1857 / DSM 23137 / MP5ACTX8) TaxID=682795 RepID=G8NUP9_GRAMM|nr:hypothetical protein [Granulicella mallensis]AEU37589.1 hypothetical protein AciX8_3289 [Granulicella mallensis MP5ACTX8]